MTSNRIQKLLYSEYSDLEDVVLVESPFAETNRQGQGIRQVQIGLTPTKLVLASYTMKPLDVFAKTYLPKDGEDPDIGSFELVSAYPVDSVNLSVFRHKRRQTLKARFCNGKVCYYEIGGYQERKMLWSLWCERVKFLSPYESGTSVSETSVASNSSGSLYIVRSALSLTQTGQLTLWCHFKTDGNKNSWVEPLTYLGPDSHEEGINYMTVPAIGEVTGRKGKTRIKKEPLKEHLVLSPEHAMLADEAVLLWQSQSVQFRKVHRRSGFYPFPDLQGGLGWWRLSKPQACTFKGRRSTSMIHLCELRSELAIHLTRTKSQKNLALPALGQDKLFQFAEDKPPQDTLKFWTADEESQHHEQKLPLSTLPQPFNTEPVRCDAEFEMLNPTIKRTNKITTTKNLFCENRVEGGRGEAHPGSGDSSSSQSLSSDLQLSAAKKQLPGQTITTGLADLDTQDDVRLSKQKRFTSSSLAHQLTMIDKHLFLQLTTMELARLREDRCCYHTPHLKALISFSQRISSLVASHVISGSTIKERAVLIVTYIGASFKCHGLNNLQSAESVLRGLQCPAVHRLHRTWAYVRKHHASKYRRFVDLSRRYYDPRLPLYQRTFNTMTETPPYLPCVSLLLAAMLGTLQNLPQVKFSKFSQECSKMCEYSAPAATTSRANTLPSSLHRFLSALNIHPPPLPESKPSHCQSHCQLQSLSRETLEQFLDQFFVPVSTSCPARRLLQDVDYFLESNQGAASRYSIPINTKVRSFLLQTKYESMPRLFVKSRQIEP